MSREFYSDLVKRSQRQTADIISARTTTHSSLASKHIALATRAIIAQALWAKATDPTALGCFQRSFLTSSSPSPSTNCRVDFNTESRRLSQYDWVGIYISTSIACVLCGVRTCVGIYSRIHHPKSIHIFVGSISENSFPNTSFKARMYLISLFALLYRTISDRPFLYFLLSSSVSAVCSENMQTRYTNHKLKTNQQIRDDSS